MTERNIIYSGLSAAAWGYFFLHFNINLGTVSILPAFVGYLLLKAAIGNLSQERRNLALLRPLCILLAVWTGVDWLLSWTGTYVNVLLPPLNVVIVAAGLYFHFQFLTDMSALAETYQPEGVDLDQQILRRRTVYIVMLTASQVLAYLPVGRFEEQRGFAMMALIVLQVIVAVIIMLDLFHLRQYFREEETEQEDG